mmetsp:Transcript_6970/g.16786  ORF Transcript_6970/g.16786 Transcript_6970/m.16786 type:complete len:510 (-) Transcript_6970:28-1557(-)
MFLPKKLIVKLRKIQRRLFESQAVRLDAVICLFGASQFRDGSLSDNFFRHLTGVVVGNLPFSIFVCVDKRVSGLDLIASGSHGEFIDTIIHAVVVSDGDVRFQDFSLRLLLAEINEVALDGIVVGTRDVRDGRQQAWSCLAGVSGSNLVGVQSGQSRVPLSEEFLDFLLGDSDRSGRDLFRHLTGVVVGNFPLSFFVHVDERVSGLDLVTSGSEGELVKTNILAPVGSNGDKRFEDFSLRLLLEEGIEVVGDRGLVVTRDIGDGGQQDTLGCISRCDQRRVTSGQRIVPKVEQVLDFFLLDRSSNVNALGHDTGMMVGNLPLVSFVDIDVTVSGLNLVASSTHGELVDSAILGPSVSDTNITFKDFSLRFLQEESIEVILDGVEVTTGDIRNSRKKDGTGLHGVSACDQSGVTGGQGVVPQAEQSTDFVLSDVRSSGGLDNLLFAGEEAAKPHVELGGRSRGSDTGVGHSRDDRSRRSEGRDSRGGCYGSNDDESRVSEFHLEGCCFQK